MNTVSLDYITLRIPGPMLGRADDPESRKLAWYALLLELPSAIYQWLRALPWLPMEPRGIYSAWHQCLKTKAVMKWSSEHGYIWIELAGAACRQLAADGLLNHAAQITPSHCRRFDLAVDVGDHRPSDIVAAGHSGRFASITDWQSATGHTIYVGSMKSERYARVYRYAPPHPRSDCARVEYVFQGDVSAWALETFAHHGLMTLARLAATTWAWKHEALLPERPLKLALPTIGIRQSDAGRLRWLHRQVVPALRNMLAQGLISTDELLTLLDASSSDPDADSTVTIRNS